MEQMRGWSLGWEGYAGFDLENTGYHSLGATRFNRKHKGTMEDIRRQVRQRKPVLRSALQCPCRLGVASPVQGLGDANE